MNRSTALLAGLMVAATVSPLSAQSPERFTVTGNRVAIYNLVGAITVGPGTGSDVTVEVTRKGADGSQLRIETGPIGGSETLRIIFPGDEIIYGNQDWNGRTEMYVRDDGTFGGGWDRRDRERGRRVNLRSRGDGLEAYADLRVMIPAGKEVGVFIGLGQLDASNVNGTIRLDASSGNITAERMRGSLLVDTGSGNVDVSNVEGSELNIDTGSGDVRVTGAMSTDVNIDTGSGNVTGTTITATDLSVDTGSGNIELRSVKATSLNMDTGSGDVDVALLSDTDDIMVDTGSGNVTISVPAGFGSAVNLSTSSGDVETDIDIQVSRRGRQHLVGRIGDGQGRMTVETGSGNVTIRGSR
jgi:lia operon protein LiaG